MFHIYIYIEHLGFCLPSLAAEIRPGVRAIYPDPQVGAQHTLPGTSFFSFFIGFPKKLVTNSSVKLNLILLNRI